MISLFEFLEGRFLKEMFDFFKIFLDPLVQTLQVIQFNIQKCISIFQVDDWISVDCIFIYFLLDAGLVLQIVFFLQIHWCACDVSQKDGLEYVLFFSLLQLLPIESRHVEEKLRLTQFLFVHAQSSKFIIILANLIWKISLIIYQLNIHKLHFKKSRKNQLIFLYFLLSKL